ncbi:MAG: UDP-N-acetylmuramate--L-alanine ligase [Armatimonadetes bacterium]|nr:UDP-N-acetylmuramate--L-alanine ligase [Armatimonadota bacterium]
MTQKHLHFIGIGGIGMSALARMMLARGYRVSGSDIADGREVQGLRREGALCYQGHAPGQLGWPEAVVYSSAIPEDNPELCAARRRGVTVLHRARMLGFLMRESFGIAIAGSHGKTTTSGLLAWILHRTGHRPDAILGGELMGLETNALSGGGPFFVAEADESDGSLLELSPQIAVVTSADIDVNPNACAFRSCGFERRKLTREVEAVFEQFADSLPPEGRLVVCHDHPRARRLRRGGFKRSYGLGEGADVRGTRVSRQGLWACCTVLADGRRLGRLDVPMPGEHNLSNALAAVTVCLELGIPFRAIAGAVREFPGVRRRFERVGEANGVLFIDDYAHNPSKVRAALSAARGVGAQRVVALFQPHRYSRTRLFFDEFACAFEDADVLLMTDIYPAGEMPLLGTSSLRLLGAVRAHGKPERVLHTPGPEEIRLAVRAECQPGGLVLAMGAGSVSGWVRELPGLLAGSRAAAAISA